MKLLNFLIQMLVRTVIVLVVFAYFLFAIVFISVPVFHNLAECERLESNYVTCQQYETSVDLTVWAIANLFSLPIDLSDARFSYQLKGTEVYDGALYLETSDEPILYKHRFKNSHSYEYTSKKVASLIAGQGAAKSTLLLENLFVTSIMYLFACLSVGGLIIGISYYLDNKLSAKISQLNKKNQAQSQL